MNATLGKAAIACFCCTALLGCQSAGPPNAHHHATQKNIRESLPRAEAEGMATQARSMPEVRQVSGELKDDSGQVAQAGFVTTTTASHPRLLQNQPLFQGRMVQAVSPQQNCRCPSCNSSNGTYCPVYTDLGESCPPPSQVPDSRWIDPQEYIFDGGDRDPRVVVRTDGSVAGLQPEDTVIHYERRNGDTYVEPACRAPIYAPRFAAVRKITSTRENDVAISPYAAKQPVAASTSRASLPPLKVRQPVRAVPEKGVRVVEAFRDRNRGIPVERTIPTLGYEETLLPYADIQFLRTGQKSETDIVKLERGVAAARAWASDEFIQVIVDGEEAAIMKEEKSTAATVLYDYRGKPCIRICKVASHQIAEPGDEVEFTIRFDNTGVEEVSNVVILDSLAPRLEYVEGSQKTSIATRFSTTENEAGSSILRWELESSLREGQGGYIRFRCLVR